MKANEQIELIKKIIENGSDDMFTFDELRHVVNTIRGWDGAMEHLDAMPNDEDFFESYFNDKYDVARSVYFGKWCPNDDYIRFDGYGNVESLTEYEYEEELRESFVEIMEYAVHLLETQPRYVQDEFDDVFSQYEDYFEEEAENEITDPE